MVDKKEISELPPAILSKILKLKEIEVQLGHIPPENWNLANLSKDIQSDDYQESKGQLIKQTEILFAEICEDMVQRHYVPEQIVQVFNSMLCYTGGPKYCNESEVLEALGQK